MNDRSRFYDERDLRSRELGLRSSSAESPIGVAIGGEAWCHAGQVATLALCNLVARVHREVHLAIPDAPLLAQSLVPASTLREAAVETVGAIDPFCRVELVDDVRHVSNSVGLGSSVAHASWYAGASGPRGILHQNPQAIERQSLLGAGMAACLAAAALFLTAHGQPVTPRTVSAWNCSEDARLSTVQLTRVVDVGDVFVVGGGAVASAFQYWLREFQVLGRWDVADGDLVELHNTARAMCMLASHAGWGGGDKLRKVDVFSATLPAARPFFGWYHEWLAANDGAHHDLVLPLANEHGVRRAIAHRHEPIILHATTSRSWQAQMHRHIAGLDDCIDCRVRGVAAPARFGCSSAPLQLAADSTNDAALPFLSAAAGLFLLSAVLRLQDGSLVGDQSNQWSLDFMSGHRATQRSRRRCFDDCVSAVPAEIRRAVASRTRWSHLAAPP